MGDPGENDLKKVHGAGSYERFRRNRDKLVCVTVPLSNRPNLTDDEKISLRHLEQFLGHYDKYLVAPKGLEISIPGFGIKRFDGKFFGSGMAHNKLLLSTGFYKTFAEYRFILNYHLDSLVFSDQLQWWCSQDYDFIGAPWIEHKDAPYGPMLAGKVGNGGFSLRKVESFLKVLKSKAYAVHPSEYWAKYYGSRPLHVRLWNLPKLLIKKMGFRNNVRWDISRVLQNWSEENFWADYADHYCPGFKIASVDEALKFAFECVPRYCFEKNDFGLPFGCHAWPKYDRQFWEPFLLK